MPKVIEDKIVYKAVMQVVSERGYAGATTKQMADAANISEMTLFRKYGSKAELVKRAILSITEQTDFSSAAQYTGNIHVDFLRVVQAYQDSVIKNGYFFATLFTELSRHPDLLETLDEPIEIFSAIEKLVSRYQKEGTLRQEHSTYFVATLLGPMMYTALMQGAMPNSHFPPRDLSTSVKFFLEGHTNIPIESNKINQ